MKDINLRMLALNAKRTAQSVVKLEKTKESLIAKIAKLQEELNNTNEEIMLWETPIVTLTGGLTSSDIITREVVDNKVIWKLKYPETVLPVDYNTVLDEKDESEQGDSIKAEPTVESIGYINPNSNGLPTPEKDSEYEEQPAVDFTSAIKPSVIEEDTDEEETCNAW